MQATSGLRGAAPPAPPTPATSAALHARILALVEQLGEATDVAVWQASQPDYLPWQPFVQALKRLHAAGQLQFVCLAPGHWVVRSLTWVTATAQRKPPPPTAPRPGKRPPPKKPAPPKQPPKPPQAKSPPTRSPRTRRGATSTR